MKLLDADARLSLNKPIEKSRKISLRVLDDNNVHTNTPQALQDLLDELEASRAYRKRAWEILRELRWVLKDVAGIEFPPAARKTIDMEGRVVKDAVRQFDKLSRIARPRSPI